MAADLLNVEGLQQLDPRAPVVMVNLMGFRERSLSGCGSGSDAYLRYSVLVAAFVAMMTSAEYETRCDPHRRNGCAERLIIATAAAFSTFRTDLSRSRRPGSGWQPIPPRLVRRAALLRLCCLWLATRGGA